MSDIRKLLEQYILEIKKQPKFNLERLLSLKGHSTIKKYVQHVGHLLGESEFSAGRLAYDVGNDYIVKLARTDADHNGTSGINQNRTEVMTQHKAPDDAPIAHVYAYDPNFFWILQQKVVPISSREQINEKIHDIFKDDNVDLIRVLRKLSEYPDDPEFMKNEWYASLRNFFKKTSAWAGDLGWRNWGITSNGRLVILDMGL